MAFWATMTAGLLVALLIFLLSYDAKKRIKKVNWPHVYEMEHEIWPELKWEHPDSCQKCWLVRDRESHAKKSEPIKVKMPPNYYPDFIVDKEIRPDPPKYYPVRTSNEPLVAETMNGDATIVPTIAFETKPVRYYGSQESLLSLLDWYNGIQPQSGHCWWVEDVRKYFIWDPYGGWQKVEQALPMSGFG